MTARELTRLLDNADETHEQRQEKAAADVLAAARRCFSWFGVEQLRELTPDLMKVIAQRLATHSFVMGGAIWAREHAGLLRAWDAYQTLDPVAASIDLAAQESF